MLIGNWTTLCQLSYSITVLQLSGITHYHIMTVIEALYCQNEENNCKMISMIITWCKHGRLLNRSPATTCSKQTLHVNSSSVILLVASASCFFCTAKANMKYWKQQGLRTMVVQSRPCMCLDTRLIETKRAQPLAVWLLWYYHGWLMKFQRV